MLITFQCVQLLTTLSLLKVMRLRYLRKQKGGRLDNVATFCSWCAENQHADATWILEKSIMSADEANDDFAHVGLTQILQKPFIVKLMLPGRRAMQEMKVQRLFSQHPNKHIVQGICSFICNDMPVRWNKRIDKPTQFCNIKGENMLVMIQEYIMDGDLSNVPSKFWTFEIWKTIVQQLTLAIIELFEEYGFVHGDWHFGNILLDKTENIEHEYNVLGKVWKVKTLGMSPVLTDFSRSSIIKKDDRNIETLTDQLGLIWDLFKNVCPSPDFKKHMGQISIDISECSSIKSVKNFIENDTKIFWYSSV